MSHFADEAGAAEQVMEYMKYPDMDTALSMVRLAKYVADRGHMAVVCTEDSTPNSSAAGVIFYRDENQDLPHGGWWKI